MQLPYRLGIDLGTNSLGLAVIELGRDGTPLRPTHLAVRIFSDGREDKTNTSLAVARRDARGMRRRRDRFLRRQQRVMKQLIAVGLMPENKAEREKLQALDPYALRVKGLDEKLEPHELGRALFHLNQRRGFKSNRKREADDTESGAIKDAHRITLQKMEEYRTYGEFLSQQKVKRIRNTSSEANKVLYAFYPHRSDIEAEYDALLAVQRVYHPNLLTNEAVNALKEEIFHQRSLCPVARGKCCIWPENERAYMALPSSQYFRLLKEINNLCITDRFVRRNRCDLSEEQRQKALSHLMRHKEVKFSALAKKIGLSADQAFNFETDVRDKLYGLPTSAVLANKKCFDEAWYDLPLRKQDEIVMLLLENDDDDALTIELKQQFPYLTDEQCSAIFSAPLEDGVLRYSQEVVQQLLPELESKNDNDQYKNEYEAIIDCGLPSPTHYTGEILDELPYYGEVLERKTQVVKYGSADEKEYGRIANPTVHIALNQLRKAVNDVIARWGTPQEIAIEFSRGLKMSKKQKEKYNRELRANEARNQRYAEQVEGMHPPKNYGLRMKLWEEQDEFCAYSVPARKLSLQEVLSDKVDIDHILPISKTLDDGNANKVLILRELNRHKGNRTPYEAFHNDKHALVVDYEELLLRIEKIAPKQKWRYLEDAMQRFTDERKNGDAGWLARQLTDTSYMARLAREYLRYIVGDHAGKKGFSKVDVYPGKLTSKLRRAWGYNGLINPNSDEKNRNDHRHHAIDALIIACANRQMLHRISTAAARGEDTGESWLKTLPAPFERVVVQQKVDEIVISHKPDHGSAGVDGATTSRLHKDTYYGKPAEQGEWGGRDAPKKSFVRFHVRKPLVSLKEKEIGDIVDAPLRRRIAEAMAARDGVKYEVAIANFSRATGIRRVRVFDDMSERSVRAIHDKQGKPYRYVLTGGNHHVDVFCPIKDKKELKIKAGNWYAEAVSHFDANSKEYAPDWKREYPAAKRIMRLHINDMVAYDEDGKRVICRVQNIKNKTAGLKISLKQHADASTADGWEASPKQLQEKNARKVSVSPSGRLQDPGSSPVHKAAAKVS
ncbi:MAG: type II CRISPR RNA-guided endonuclease Cas9 [Alphaproteobacteria bacterium]|nr:type II CRISPR RNA-guided endonuclease Cas9 [Alphaproteobacteria bacterium]